MAGPPASAGDADPLTGLATREVFLRRVQARMDGDDFAVVLVDVDRFGLVNDALGYGMGDALLVALAGRLRSCGRDSEAVARVGDDRFALLQPVADPSDAAAIAARIHDAMTRPFALDGRELFVSVTVGVAMATVDRWRPESLLFDGGAAVRRAREFGRGHWALFDRVTRAEVAARVETRTALYRAIERDEFCLHYQPVVAAATGQTTGVEALLRWEHPDLGLVPPDQFIPLAEETGLIVPIGTWVLGRACAQLAEWHRRLGAGTRFTMSINLSAVQLHDPAVVPRVRRAVDDAGVPPEAVTLEITESMVLEDAEQLIATLRGLRAFGVRIAVDDFGTGWSALAYLKRLPLDELKVDRTFVAGLLTERADRAIAEAVVALAKALDLTAVAEGVETAAQLDVVRDLGCDAAQGFLFSRPLPPADLEALLVSRQ